MDSSPKLTPTSARGSGITDWVMQPTNGTPFKIGHGIFLGAYGYGVGTLCKYVVWLPVDCAFERSVNWSATVKNRLRTTYAYFGGSLFLTAVTGAVCSRSSTVTNLLKNSWIYFGGIVVFVGSDLICE